MKPVIYLVDDDDAVRTGLASFLQSHGYRVAAFRTGQDFLDSYRAAPEAGCLLLDLKLPGMSGLFVQEELVAADIDLPIIFMSAYGTVQESVKAMKTGASDFLQKPFSSAVLLERIEEALGRDRAVRERDAALQQARALYARLTERERQVAALVVSGHTSKNIAQILGISPRTADHHRTRILAKLEVESIVELAALAAALGNGKGNGNGNGNGKGPARDRDKEPSA